MSDYGFCGGFCEPCRGGYQPPVPPRPPDFPVGAAALGGPFSRSLRVPLRTAGPAGPGPVRANPPYRPFFQRNTPAHPPHDLRISLRTGGW